MNFLVQFEYGFGFYISHLDDVLVDVSEDADGTEMMMTSGLVISIPFLSFLIYRDIRG